MRQCEGGLDVHSESVVVYVDSLARARSKQLAQANCKSIAQARLTG